MIAARSVIREIGLTPVKRIQEVDSRRPAQDWATRIGVRLHGLDAYYERLSRTSPQTDERASSQFWPILVELSALERWVEFYAGDDSARREIINAVRVAPREIDQFFLAQVLRSNLLFSDELRNRCEQILKEREHASK